MNKHVMKTVDPCTMCEKIVVTLEANRLLTLLTELPNTLDPQTGRCLWKFHEFFGFALLPRSVQGVHGQVDLYFCIDEEDADVIDVFGYAKKFFLETILPQWTLFRTAQLAHPVVSSADESMCCRKLHHQSLWDQA